MDKGLWNSPKVLLLRVVLSVIALGAVLIFAGCSTKWTSEGDLYKAISYKQERSVSYCPSSTVLYTAPGIAGTVLFVPCSKLDWRTSGWANAGVEV